MTTPDPSAQAVIYCPDPHDIAGIDRCMDYLRRRRYIFSGLFTGPEHFAEAEQMVTHGKAEILIMAGCGDVPPRAVPRWEFVSHELRRRPSNQLPLADDDTRPIRNRLRRPRPL